MFTVRACVLSHSSEPLSDERAQEIIDKALESRSVQMRNLVSVITGLMGSGKTWFLSRLFNQQPPDLYTSTGITEQSFRGLLRHIMSLSSWQHFSHRNILEFLAILFHENVSQVETVNSYTETASIQSPRPAPIQQPPPLMLPSASSSTSIHMEVPAPHSLQLKNTTTGQSIVRLVKAPKSSQSLTMLELIHLIDTGGQPELMEHIPSLIYSCHLAVLVLNLMFDLDEYPLMHFHEKGKAYKRTLPSQHTGRQAIKQLACTLQAKRFTQKKDQLFRLLVVATHKDCVLGDLAARVKVFDQALKDILLPACDAELIRYSASEIPFVLNLKNPDSDDRSKLELIRTKISESGVGGVIDVPASFLIFEQELMEFATKKGRDILSLDECLQVGGKLKMKAEVVEAALIFFHRQVTFLYFRYVLPNVVFTKPQVPFEFIKTVMQFSYKVNSGELKGVTEKLVTSMRDGIITEEILGHNLLSNCFIPNLYEPQHAIDLLSHTFALAPLSREPPTMTEHSEVVQPSASTFTSREKREYLMLSLCPAIPDKELSHHIPVTSEIATLVVKFSKDCVPLSCFSSTICYLLSMYDWRLCRAKDSSPKCLAHNVVSLYDPQVPAQIVLVDAANHLEIHISVNDGVDREMFPTVCFHIRETVFAAITKVLDIMNLSKVEISPAFLCPCATFSESHPASTFEFESNIFLRCSRTMESVGLTLGKHKIWLETPEIEREKPSLPKLYLLNVPERVGVDYRIFGTLLLNDVNGTLVDAIEHDCLRQSHHITSKILQMWISGAGEPPTWQTLVQVLRDCKLTVLADQIQNDCLEKCKMWFTSQPMHNGSRNECVSPTSYIC